jgi:hypothetical protein
VSIGVSVSSVILADFIVFQQASVWFWCLLVSFDPYRPVILLFRLIQADFCLSKRVFSWCSAVLANLVIFKPVHCCCSCQFRQIFGQFSLLIGQFCCFAAGSNCFWVGLVAFQPFLQYFQSVPVAFQPV